MSASSTDPKPSHKHRDKDSDHTETTKLDTVEMKNLITEDEAHTSALTVKKGGSSKAVPAPIAEHKPGLANQRPIYPSNIHVLDVTFLNRPIEVASFVVNETFGEHRPVAVSEHKYIESAIIPHNRPVGISEIHGAGYTVLPNNRPIASNESKGIGAMMGYLD